MLPIKPRYLASFMISVISGLGAGVLYLGSFIKKPLYFIQDYSCRYRNQQDIKELLSFVAKCGHIVTLALS